MNYVLDTHTWVWWNMRPEKLSSKVKSIVSGIKENQKLYLSAISIWEFSMLIAKERLSISCDGREWLEEALDDPFLEVVPLSTKVCWESTHLPGDFHSDPADRLIVASARICKAALLSKDAHIRKYSHVKTIW